MVNQNQKCWYLQSYIPKNKESCKTKLDSKYYLWPVKYGNCWNIGSNTRQMTKTIERPEHQISTKTFNIYRTLFYISFIYPKHIQVGLTIHTWIPITPFQATSWANNNHKRTNLIVTDEKNNYNWICMRIEEGTGLALLSHHWKLVRRE